MRIDPSLPSPATVIPKLTARPARLACDLDHIAAAQTAAEFAQAPRTIDAMTGGSHE